MRHSAGTWSGKTSEVPCVPLFRPEWDALSAKHLNGKLRPIPKANSGTHFSKACPSGKPVPLWTHPGTEPSTYQASHQ